MTKRDSRLENFYILGVYALEYDEEYEGILPMLLFKEAFFSLLSAKDYAEKFNKVVRPESKPIRWTQTTATTVSSMNTSSLGFEVREKELAWEDK